MSCYLCVVSIVVENGWSFWYAIGMLIKVRPADVLSPCYLPRKNVLARLLSASGSHKRRPSTDADRSL